MKQEPPDVNGNSVISIPTTPEPTQVTQPVEDVSIKKEPNDTSSSMDSQNSSVLDNLFGDVFVTKIEGAKPANHRLELEIMSYRAESTVPLGCDPLSWWRERKYSYPILSNMAQYFLAIPATSVASERVFSTAGDIVTSQRAALSPENVDLLIFLKSNLNVPTELM